MKKTGLLAATIALGATSAFAETQTFQLVGFTQVSAAAGVEVIVSVGGDYSVRAEGSAEAIERLKVELVGDELHIGRRHQGFRWKRSGHVVVHVTTPSLAALGVSSGASVDATGVDAGAFAIDASSGGSLEVDGRCDALTVDVSSGGDIEARELVCRTAIADASSGGNAEIFASESIVGEASSGGNVDVFGKPNNVTKDTSSGGNVSIE